MAKEVITFFYRWSAECAEGAAKMSRDLQFYTCFSCLERCYGQLRVDFSQRRICREFSNIKSP